MSNLHSHLLPSIFKWVPRFHRDEGESRFAIKDSSVE